MGCERGERRDRQRQRGEGGGGEEMAEVRLVLAIWGMN